MSSLGLPRPEELVREMNARRLDYLERHELLLSLYGSLCRVCEAAERLDEPELNHLIEQAGTEIAALLERPQPSYGPAEDSREA
jgi:hypothetical protein